MRFLGLEKSCILVLALFVCGCSYGSSAIIRIDPKTTNLPTPIERFRASCAQLGYQYFEIDPGEPSGVRGICALLTADRTNHRFSVTLFEHPQTEWYLRFSEPWKTEFTAAGLCDYWRWVAALRTALGETAVIPATKSLNGQDMEAGGVRVLCGPPDEGLSQIQPEQQ